MKQKKAAAKKKHKKKIVLAYSGGLDTSIILKWLQENFNADVIAYTACLLYTSPSPRDRG